MLRKHLIIEGMDGTGKDTLIGQLKEYFPDHTTHARASTSLGGPVPHLTQWVTDDLLELERRSDLRWIYNRHPLLSENIYRPFRFVKREAESGFWNDLRWLRYMRTQLGKHAMVVICQPPFHVVRQNLNNSADQHMPGVVENVIDLYNSYANLTWPGALVRYDYTCETPGTLVDILYRYLEI